MRGTASGAVVLHVAPDAASGGPLRLVRNGAHIRLSVTERRLDLLVPEVELAERRNSLPIAPTPPRGYARLYQREVLQADEGCGFDFLLSRPRHS